MEKVFCHPEVHHPYIIMRQIISTDFIFQLLSIISQPFGFILQQTPIQNYINEFLSWRNQNRHFFQK